MSRWLGPACRGDSYIVQNLVCMVLLGPGRPGFDYATGTLTGLPCIHAQLTTPLSPATYSYSCELPIYALGLNICMHAKLYILAI